MGVEPDYGKAAMKTKIALLMALLIAGQLGFSQGFVNLDFEDATIAPTSVGGSTYPADPTQAFPGWTVGGSGTVVSYNDLSLGAPAIDLMGPNFPNFAGYTPLQGSYSVLLQYFGGIFSPPTLSQTGFGSSQCTIHFFFSACRSECGLSAIYSSYFEWGEHSIVSHCRRTRSG
jgi:hypothetical protein